MTEPDSAYTGRVITFATMHGKQRLAEEPFRRILGAIVTAPPGLDTDQFGTFAGDIPRTLSPQAAAQAKARRGMLLAGTSCGLASEGSFSTGFGPIVDNTEILLFIDDTLGLELVEGTVGTSPLPGGRSVRSVDDALHFASAAGFPEQGVIVQSTVNGVLTAHKNLDHSDLLAQTVESLLSAQASIVIMPDYRAHRAPSRAATIRILCERMAQRVDTPCPHCHTPGFGQIDVERGLPCSLCGSPTAVIAADVLGCARCDHRERRARAHAHAEPQWCDSCNP